MTTTDGATVATAIFTAFAAGAAWRTVVLDSRRQKLAHIPHLDAVIQAMADGRVRVAITNAGPGIALGVLALGVTGTGYKFASGIPEGSLAPSGSGYASLAAERERRFGDFDDAKLVWSCRDTQGVVYWWTGTASGTLTPPPVPTAADVFAIAFPTVDFSSSVPNWR